MCVLEAMSSKTSLCAVWCAVCIAYCMRMFCIFCFGTVSDGELYVRARVIIIPIIMTKS